MEGYDFMQILVNTCNTEISKIDFIKMLSRRKAVFITKNLNSVVGPITSMFVNILMPCTFEWRFRNLKFTIMITMNS